MSCDDDAPIYDAKLFLKLSAAVEGWLGELALYCGRGPLFERDDDGDDWRLEEFKKFVLAMTSWSDDVGIQFGHFSPMIVLADGSAASIAEYEIKVVNRPEIKRLRMIEPTAHLAAAEIIKNASGHVLLTAFDYDDDDHGLVSIDDVALRIEERRDKFSATFEALFGDLRTLLEISRMAARVNRERTLVAPLLACPDSSNGCDPPGSVAGQLPEAPEDVFHAADNARPEKFAHGPIKGNQAQLVVWLGAHTNARASLHRALPKLLKARRNDLWAQKTEHKRTILVYFRDAAQYRRALENQKSVCGVGA